MDSPLKVLGSFRFQEYKFGKCGESLEKWGTGREEYKLDITTAIK